MVGEILRLVVDTNHFKGNFPESVAVNACLAPDNDASVRSIVDIIFFVLSSRPKRGKVEAMFTSVFLSRNEAPSVKPVNDCHFHDTHY